MVELWDYKSNEKMIPHDFEGLKTDKRFNTLLRTNKAQTQTYNIETNKIANEFFKKANQEKKIKTIVKPALETLEELRNDNLMFDIMYNNFFFILGED